MCAAALSLLGIVVGRLNCLNLFFSKKKKEKIFAVGLKIYIKDWSPPPPPGGIKIRKTVFEFSFPFFPFLTRVQ